MFNDRAIRRTARLVAASLLVNPVSIAVAQNAAAPSIAMPPPDVKPFDLRAITPLNDRHNNKGCEVPSMEGQYSGASVITGFNHVGQPKPEAAKYVILHPKINTQVNYQKITDPISIDLNSPGKNSATDISFAQLAWSACYWVLTSTDPAAQAIRDHNRFTPVRQITSPMGGDGATTAATQNNTWGNPYHFGD